MNTVLVMVGCLVFIVAVLVALLLFVWWNLPCAEGDTEVAGSEPPRQP